MLKVDKSIRDSLISESIAGRIWEYDLLTGETNIVEVLIDFLEYSKPEIYNKIDCWLSLIHTDDLEETSKTLMEVINGRKQFFKAKYRIKSKENDYIWVNSVGKSLKDKQGRTVYIAGAHMDISSYNQMEEDLKEITEINKKIIELSPHGVYIVENGLIIYANNPGLQLLGAKCENEVVGKNRLEFIVEGDRKKVISDNPSIYDSQVATEMGLVKLDGSTIICDIYSASIFKQNKKLALTYVNDITEKKKILEENEKLLGKTLEYDKIKTEFFSNISHELRTPINIILSAIQLLNSIHKSSNSDYRNFIALYEKYIGIMSQNGYRLLKLINNIIDLTKIDSGFSPINLSNNNIVEVVEDITLSVVEYIQNRNIELIFDTDIEEKIIACDEDKIERIMLNLLSNSIKYTGAGGTIKVNIKDLGNNISISVEDTGIGIPEDKLDIIFERFRQVDELFARRSEGSGIGLSLVKCLVEAHGGTISVSSTIAVGSKFEILLPNRNIEESEDFYKNLNITHDENQYQKKTEKISIEFSDI